mgnify:CR=1
MKILKIGTLLETLLESKKGSRYEGPFWLQELLGMVRLFIFAPFI